MAVLGVVCEYNPFHNGHAYHLQYSREAVGEDSTVICVMSGDFVQRGEAAVFSKFARAEAACRCGADLIVELPLPWCLSSAERFASGAVDILAKLGADVLSFGSETGEPEPLERLAAALLSPELGAAVKSRLLEQPNQSYAAARQAVLLENLGGDALLLSQPNNILAVEYLKAIRGSGRAIRPLAVKRLGGGHDEAHTVEGYRSAAEIRRMLQNRENLCGEVPPAAAGIYTHERELGRERGDSILETAMLSRLRRMSREDFEQLPDAADGLGLRLYQAVRSEGSLEAIQMAARTKRYPLARIRRMCMCACLGITGNMSEGNPPYARILALNARGQSYLGGIRKRGELPLLTKAAAVQKLPDRGREVFELGAQAHDFYVLSYTNPEMRIPGEDWKNAPVRIDGP